jgi:hypothetical protein
LLPPVPASGLPPPPPLPPPPRERPSMPSKQGMLLHFIMIVSWL